MLYAFGAGEAPISVGGCDPSRGAMVHTIRVGGRGHRRALRRGARAARSALAGPFGAAWPLAEAEGADV